MLPVTHHTPQILVAVNYCRCQLAKRLRWAAPAYHKKEGATPRPGACRHTYSMTGNLMGDLGCGLGRGIQVV